MAKTLAERFFSFAMHGAGPHECWTWHGMKNNHGYGMIYAGKAKRAKSLAHRVSWELFNGPIPEGKNVLHRCDNPECCNPEHLFIGSQLENMRDKIAKGRAYPSGWLENVRAAMAKRRHPDGTWKERQRVARREFVGPPKPNAARFAKGSAAGEGSHRAKLTDRDVLAIRALHAAGTHPYSALAAQFGVTAGMIGHIVRRMSWTHI